MLPWNIPHIYFWFIWGSDTEVLIKMVPHVLKIAYQEPYYSNGGNMPLVRFERLWTNRHGLYNDCFILISATHGFKELSIFFIVIANYSVDILYKFRVFGQDAPNSRNSVEEDVCDGVKVFGARSSVKSEINTSFV